MNILLDKPQRVFAVRKPTVKKRYTSHDNDIKD